MKKSDLEDGMIVDINNGKRCIVLKSYGSNEFILRGYETYISGECYNDDLTGCDNYMTIVKVYDSIFKPRWIREEENSENLNSDDDFGLLLKTDIEPNRIYNIKTGEEIINDELCNALSEWKDILKEEE
jgi:hypothetical protein